VRLASAAGGDGRRKLTRGPAPRRRTASSQQLVELRFERFLADVSPASAFQLRVLIE
jgi:hypothetical protein